MTIPPYRDAPGWWLSRITVVLAFAGMLGWALIDWLRGAL